MFLYALPFTWGFLNFEFGLAVALWGIAFGILVFERSWASRLAVNTIFVAVLFASHFFALGVYGLTLGILELWRAWEKKVPYGETAMRLVVLAIPAAILLAVMKLTGGAVGGGENDWHFQFKALWPYIIMNGYSTVVSAVTTVLLIGFSMSPASAACSRSSGRGFVLPPDFLRFISRSRRSFSARPLSIYG